MKFQSKSAIAYIMRNFWKLVYVVLPVAVLMAFFANPNREIEFLKSMLCGQLTTDNILLLFNNAYTVLRLGDFWWVNLIIFVLLAFTVAMLIVKISRHMRVGIMSALPFKWAFGLFPVTLLALFAYFCLSEIAMLLPVGIMYILRSTDNVIVMSVVSVSVAFAVRLLAVWIFMLLVLALPLKHSENYHFNVGLSYSARVMTKLPRQVWTITLVYAFGRFVVMLCGYFLRPYYLDIVLYALVYIFAVMFLPSFAYRVYHDVVGGERRDVSHTIFD